MNRLPLKLSPAAIGKYVRSHSIFPFLPENALFWMLLLLLSMGSAVTLYGKVTGNDQLKAVNTPPENAAYYYEYPLSSGGVVRFYEP